MKIQSRSTSRLAQPLMILSLSISLVLAMFISITDVTLAQGNPTATPTPTQTPTIDYENEELVVYQVVSDEEPLLWNGLDVNSPSIISTLRPDSLIFEVGATLEVNDIFWKEIRTFDHLVGWVDADFVSDAEMFPPRRFKFGQEVVVNADNIWLRGEADPDSEDILTVLPVDTTLMIIGNNHFDSLQWWWPVLTDDNISGWIEERWLDGEEDPLEGEDGESAPIIPTVAPVVDDTQDCTVRTNYDTYTIRSGDTLSSIAELHGITYQQLMADNCLSDFTIYAGQVLYVPQAVQLVNPGSQDQTINAVPDLATTPIPPTTVPITPVIVVTTAVPNPGSQDQTNNAFPTEEAPPSQPETNDGSQNTLLDSPNSEKETNNGIPVLEDDNVPIPEPIRNAPIICIATSGFTSARVNITHYYSGEAVSVAVRVEQRDIFGTLISSSTRNETYYSSSFNVNNITADVKWVDVAYGGRSVRYNTPITFEKCSS